jgi:hypothetical protein
MVRQEVHGSAADLAAMGLRPRLFAYPYGEHSPAVRSAVADAGLALAFSLDPGLASPASDRYRIPRTEVLRRDHALRFAWKVLRMR